MGDVVKVFDQVLSSPFEAIRDASRSVKSLAQGDIEGSLGHAFKAAAGSMTYGAVGDDGYLVDTKIHRDPVVTPVEEQAAVSFTTGTDPSVTVGADESEDFLKKKSSTSSSSSTGSSSFLGGVGNTGSLVL